MSQIIQLHVYQLKKDNSKVTASVTIGNLQRSTTDLYLDGKKLNAKPIVGTFSEKKIGLDQDLAGKQLTINTTIYDINDKSNDIVYRYKIKGGTKVLNPASTKVTVSEGGVAHFFVRIFLI